MSDIRTKRHVEKTLEPIRALKQQRRQFRRHQRGQFRVEKTLEPIRALKHDN